MTLRLRRVNCHRPACPGRNLQTLSVVVDLCVFNLELARRLGLSIALAHSVAGLGLARSGHGKILTKKNRLEIDRLLDSDSENFRKSKLARRDRDHSSRGRMTVRATGVRRRIALGVDWRSPLTSRLAPPFAGKIVS